MTLGEKIKSLRLASGMSQTELGNKIGVQTSAIHKYESGLVVNLKTATIQRLAEVLDTTPAYLLGFEDTPPVADHGQKDPLDEQLIELMKQLTPDQKELLLAQIRVLKGRQ